MMALALTFGICTSFLLAALLPAIWLQRVLAGIRTDDSPAPPTEPPRESRAGARSAPLPTSRPALTGVDSIAR